MAATVTQALLAVLQADATLAAIVTGGIYSIRASDKAPINENDTPNAYAELASSGGVKQLLPCMVLSPSSGPNSEGAAGCGRREWYRVGAYERSGYVNCEAALERVHVLLHDTAIALDDGRNVDVQLVDTPIRGDIDDTIETGDDRPASYEAARYTCVTAW